MAKLIDISGKPMNGKGPQPPRFITVPDLPTDPQDLEDAALVVEKAAVRSGSDAFMVATMRALAAALRRIEALEAEADNA